jgi:cation:H+ antiporter
MLFWPILQLLAGFVVITLGAKVFVGGASALARHWKLSPLFIGIVMVGLGTSLPELLVSFLASIKHAPGLAIGNAIGSNITNMGMVLGLTACVRPLLFPKMVMRFELPVFLGIAVAVGLMLSMGRLTLWEGVVLLVFFVLYLFLVWRRAQSDPELNEDAKALQVQALPSKMRAGLYWFVGLLLVLGSAEILVHASVALAHVFHLPDVVIGLTVVAVGTSLPELAASLASAWQGDHAMAVGNIIGSNLFNLLAVLAMPALFSPGPVPAGLVKYDYSVMLAFAVVLFLGLALSRKKRLGRVSGVLLVLAYLTYVVCLVMRH